MPLSYPSLGVHWVIFKNFFIDISRCVNIINILWITLSDLSIYLKDLSKIYRSKIFSEHLFFSLKINKKHIINIPLTEGDCLSNFYRCPYQKEISTPLTTWIGAIYLLNFTKENIFSIIVKIQCTYNYVVKRKHSELNMYYIVLFYYMCMFPMEKKIKRCQKWLYMYVFFSETHGVTMVTQVCKNTRRILHSIYSNIFSCISLYLKSISCRV